LLLMQWLWSHYWSQVQMARSTLEKKIGLPDLQKIRGYKEKVELKPLYREVGENFEERLDHYLEKLPDDLSEMQRLISDKLTKLNEILPKIDSWYAQLYYESLLSFAKHVAEASGGILGFMSIDAKEKQIIKLPMIDPIKFPE
jgi:hypothetical protein